jgi:hypothetical protein
MDIKSVFQFLAIAGIFLAFCIQTSNVIAGNVIYGGTKVTMLSGTNAVSGSNFVIKSGAILSNAGVLILKK